MIKRLIVPIVTLAVAALIFFVIKDNWTSWQGGSAEQRTDDAYLRADMTPLSTRISGTVRRVDVNDYQPVTPGQVLVQLDDEDYRATLGEAQAALEGAKAQIDHLKEMAHSHDRETRIWIHVYVVCRTTEKEAKDYLNYYVYEKGDTTRLVALTKKPGGVEIQLLRIGKKEVQ